MMRITRRRLGVLWSFVAVLLLATVIPILQAQEGEAFAPADQAAFDDIAVGKRALSDFPNYYTDFISPGRFRETEGSDIWTAKIAQGSDSQ